jgi:hypothetical protein
MTVIDIADHLTTKEVWALCSKLINVINEEQIDVSVALLSLVTASYIIFEDYKLEYELNENRTYVDFINDYIEINIQEKKK